MLLLKIKLDDSSLKSLTHGQKFPLNQTTMLEHNLLDDIGKVGLRKRFHPLLEVALLIGYGLLLLYCFYQLFLIGFISADAADESILILLMAIAVGYVYSWHRFSVAYDNRNAKTPVIPIYLATLRFLSFFASGFFGFIAFLFVNFEAYKFEVTLETAQRVTLFFVLLGFLQFIYTLLTPTKP